MVCSLQNKTKMSQITKEKISELLSALAEENVDNAKAAVASLSLKDDLKEYGWDITTAICKTLDGSKAVDANVEDFYISLLMKVSEFSNPKEQIIALLEELELASNDQKLGVLIQPLLCSWKRLPTKQEFLFKLILDTFYRYVKKLPVEMFDKLEGNERTICDSSPLYRRAIHILQMFIEFIEQVKDSGVVDWGKDLQIHKSGSKFLLKVLHSPLALMPLLVRNAEIKSDARLLAEQVVQLLTSLNKQFSTFVLTEFHFTDDDGAGNEDNDDENDKDERVCRPTQSFNYGLPIFMYVLYSTDELRNNYIPLVCSSVAHVQFCSKPISVLLQCRNTTTNLCGLDLAYRVLSNMHKQCLTTAIFELEDFGLIVHSVLDCILAAEVKEVVADGAAVLRTLFGKFDSGGKYRCLLFFMKGNSDSRVHSFAISLLKDELNLCFQTALHEWMKSKKFEYLLFLCLHLEQGECTDLIQNKEYILAGLNLIRYLCLRDTHNITGIQAYVGQIVTFFTKPLQKGVQLSRAHYELEANKLADTCAVMSVDIGTQHRDHSLTKAQEREAISVAICNLDMIESVLSRVHELLEDINSNI